MAAYDVQALLDGIDYNEWGSGSETTRKLAQMLAKKAAEKFDRGLEFQEQSREANRKMFNPQMEAPPPVAQPPQQSLPPEEESAELDLADLGGPLE